MYIRKFIQYSCWLLVFGFWLNAQTNNKQLKTINEQLLTNRLVSQRLVVL